MSESNNRSGSAVVVISTVIFALSADQLTKKWALESLSPGTSSGFIPGLLNLTLTHNTGAAFSLGSEHGWLMGLLATVLALLIVAWIISRLRSESPPSTVELVGMGLLLGGACGNLTDRLLLGQVTDFLEFAFVDFPIFNVADALIDIGIGLILIASFSAPPKKEEETESESDKKSISNHAPDGSAPNAREESANRDGN